jgi:hypothetical protein
MKRLHRPSPAMSVALVALFVALGGTGYAVVKLPKNSVGSEQIKANAVRSSEVSNGSLLARDFKAGELPAGAPGLPGGKGDPCLASDPNCKGPKGDKGDPCLASDPNCKGPKGDTGEPGPRTLSFDGQYPTDGAFRPIGPPIDGMQADIACSDSGNVVAVGVGRIGEGPGFYGWGIAVHDGMLEKAVEGNDPPGPGAVFLQRIYSQGSVTAEVSVAVRKTTAGGASNYTHYDISGVRGSACNYHALIIPPG